MSTYLAHKVCVFTQGDKTRCNAILDDHVIFTALPPPRNIHRSVSPPPVDYVLQQVPSSRSMMCRHISPQVSFSPCLPCAICITSGIGVCPLSLCFFFTATGSSSRSMTCRHISPTRFTRVMKVDLHLVVMTMK